jgi:hypothetical protein
MGSFGADESMMYHLHCVNRYGGIVKPDAAVKAKRNDDTVPPLVNSLVKLEVNNARMKGRD